MLLTYKIHLLQRLQQLCAVFVYDSVDDHQMLVPHSCLSPFAPPSNISYHKRMKTTTKNYLFKFWHLFLVVRVPGYRSRGPGFDS
jgi:hypothetical protein